MTTFSIEDIDDAYRPFVVINDFVKAVSVTTNEDNTVDVYVILHDLISL